jgi:hypothetical protein
MDTNKHELNPFPGKPLDGVTVEWKTLGEVGEFRRGTAITKKQTTSANIPVIANGPLPLTPSTTKQATAGSSGSIMG